MSEPHRQWKNPWWRLIETPQKPLQRGLPMRWGQVTSFINLLHYSPLSHTNGTKVCRQRIWRHSLTAEMRSAALKAGGSEALLRSRLPGNCCYATAETPTPPHQPLQIKVQRVAHWVWTAPRRSKHLWKAMLSNFRQESRNVHGDTSAFVQFWFLLRMTLHAHHIQRCYVYFTLHMDANTYLRCGLRPGWLLMLQGSRGCADALRSWEMNEQNYIVHQHHNNSRQ